MSEWLASMQDRAARWVLGQSTSRLRKLFGEPPTNARGQSLELRVHVLMRLIALSGEGGLYRHDVARAREIYARATLEMSGAQEPLPIERQIMCEGPAGDLPATLYTWDDTTTRPVCMFYHGGGFTVGSVASYAHIARRIARRTGCAVCSVEYRLGPEHHTPAGYEDAFAAYRHVREHATELGVDGGRVWVAGDSAGGALAAGVSQLCLVRGVPQPACQLLYYPVTDPGSSWPSQSEFGEGYFLTSRDIEYFERHAGSGQGDDADVELASLLHAPPAQLRGQCPVVLVTAGFDPLRDEGEAYGEALREAGVEVYELAYGQLVHGFLTMAGWIPEVEVCINEALQVAMDVVSRGSDL